MGKWFLSYSSNDEAFAIFILDIIERNGHPCFFAKRDINAGESYAGRIKREIEECEKMVLLLSQDANNSQQVLREVNTAVNNRKDILPLIIKPVKLSDDMEYYLGVCQTIDLTAAAPEGIEDILVDKVFGRKKKAASEASTVKPSVDKIAETTVREMVAAENKPKTTAAKEQPPFIKYGKYVVFIAGLVALYKGVFVLENVSVGAVFGFIGVAIAGALAALFLEMTDNSLKKALGIICGTFVSWIAAALIYGLLCFVLPLSSTFGFILATIVYVFAIFVVAALSY